MIRNGKAKNYDVAQRQWMNGNALIRKGKEKHIEAEEWQCYAMAKYGAEVI